MGLLDNLMDDSTFRMGMGLLGGSTGRNDGAGAGQIMMEAMGSVDAWKQNKLKMEQAAQQSKMMNLQMQEAQRHFAQQKNLEDLAGKFSMPGSPALSALQGDASVGIMPSAGRPAVAPSFDYKGFANAVAASDPLKALQIQQMLQKDSQISKLDPKDYTPESVEQFKQSGNFSVLKNRDKLHMGAEGGEFKGRDQFTGKEVFSAPLSKSFSDLASERSNSVAWANHKTSSDRLEWEKGKEDKPQWIDQLGGFVNPRTQVVMPARDSSGNAVENAGPKMTEDQAKASGWLVQAENAFKNMKAATASDKDAAKPGFNDALSAIPSLGFTTGVANVMRGADRQKYMQGASSLSESLLRAATGAGVNRDEALQKVRELTPQIGDDDKTIAQKEAAIPLYIESLKMRAGPGAKRVASIMDHSGGSGGANINDPLGIFKR